MFCTRCGGRNEAQARYCMFCGAPVMPPAVMPCGPQVSGMAIASLVLGILGLFGLGVMSVPGLILGIAALGTIDGSAGRLTGRGLAVAGILLSALGILLLIGVLVVWLLMAAALA